jgi:hypothetical protein
MSAAALLMACAGQEKGATMEAEQSLPKIEEGDIVASVNLTVAEGKRLIAKGIANHPQVKERMKKGTIVILTGSTNTYIAEELVNLSEPRGSFVLGYITPNGAPNFKEGISSTKDITIIDGEWVDAPYEEALKKARKGDIVFKGANMLNYEKKQTALCIGSADGGPARRARETNADLFIPVGLEKETSGDLSVFVDLLTNKPEGVSAPRIWLHPSDAVIYTEIEAIKTVADVNVIPFAIGGIAGREGGVSLAIYGKKDEVQKALDLVASAQGEAPFVK